MKKGIYPVSLLVKTSHKKIEDPQNDKKEIENFWTSKYQNKKPFKFPKEKQISPPLWNFTQKLKDSQNDKKKIEYSEISKYKNKIFKVHMPHFLTCETSHKFFWRPPKWQEEN